MSSYAQGASSSSSTGLRFVPVSHPECGRAQLALNALGITLPVIRPAQFDGYYADNEDLVLRSNHMCPSNWVKFALPVEDLQENWQVVFHGTRLERVQAVIAKGLRKDADVPANHFSVKKGMKHIWTSPSPLYAAHPTYAAPATLHTIGGETHYIQFMFMARQRPDSHVLADGKGGKYTNTTVWSHELKMDTRCNNNVLEQWTTDSSAVQVTALLVRVSSESPMDFYNRLAQERLANPARGVCGPACNASTVDTYHPDVEQKYPTAWSKAEDAAMTAADVAQIQEDEWYHNPVVWIVAIILVIAILAPSPFGKK